MGVEIERKFLVVRDAWKSEAEGIAVRQGYLVSRPETTVRVRTAGSKAYLTIKGATVGATRSEFEYDIPLGEAEELFTLCDAPLIQKTRYTIPVGDLVWEVDEFHGANEGLLLAECELSYEDQRVDRPDWIGDEVTGDPRYYNSNLAARPFSTW